jgi:hypothetical protein
MSTIRARAWQILLCLSLVGFCYSAYAAGESGLPAAPAAVAAPISLTALLLLVACHGVVWTIRRVSPDSHFFHTKWGAVALAIVTLVLGSVIETVQMSGINTTAITIAVFNALMTFFTTSNPSVDPSTNMSKKPDPTALALALFMTMTVSGCAGGRALGACELGKLPATSQSVIATVVAVAIAGGAHWQDELEALGKTLAPGQLECVVQAIAAAWSASRATLSPERAAALERLQIYLKGHPASACGPISPALVTLVLPRA